MLLAPVNSWMDCSANSRIWWKSTVRCITSTSAGGAKCKQIGVFPWKMLNRDFEFWTWEKSLNYGEIRVKRSRQCWWRNTRGKFVNCVSIFQLCNLGLSISFVYQFPAWQFILFISLFIIVGLFLKWSDPVGPSTHVTDPSGRIRLARRKRMGWSHCLEQSVLLIQYCSHGKVSRPACKSTHKGRITAVYFLLTRLCVGI